MSHIALPTTPLLMVASNAPGAFRTIELEINTACDLACFGCDRMSDVTTDKNMALEQVKLFIAESLELDWEWERIRVLGGEPTLHPQFADIVIALAEYIETVGRGFIQVLSNGVGEKSHKAAGWLEAIGVDLHCEQKEKGVQPVWFHNTRIVQVDRDPNTGIVPPCAIFDARGCGIGLTRHGYFLDGAGATVARVSGLDIGIQSLRYVTMDNMLEQSKVLCRICGHWTSADGSIGPEKLTKTGLVTGEYWTKTLETYNRNKPQLRVYGG